MYVYMFNVMYLFNKMYYVHTSQLTLLNMLTLTLTHSCVTCDTCVHTHVVVVGCEAYVACSKDYFYFKLRVNA